MTSTPTTRAQQAIQNGLKEHGQNRFDAAARHYRGALALDPKSAQAMHLLGTLELQQNRPTAARPWLEQALALSRDDMNIWYVYGLTLEDLGDEDGALAAFEQAARLGPDSIDAQTKLAELHQKRGRGDEAEQRYRRELAVNPRDSRLLTALGSLLLNQGRAEEALPLFETAYAVQPDPELAGNLGVVLRRLGRPAEAEVRFREAVAGRPNNPLHLCNLATALIDQGNLNEAAGLLMATLQIDPNYADAHFGLGLVMEGSGHPKEAAVSYFRALQIDPNNAEYYNNLGKILLEQNDIAAARTALSQAVRLKPDYARAWMNLGNAHLAEMDLDQALAATRRGLEIAPDDAKIRTNLATLLLQSGQAEQAIAEYRRVLGQDPDNAEARFSLPYALLAAGRYQEGWAAHEDRLHPGVDPRHRIALPGLPYPLWQGEPLAGKRILLVGEQGYGDQIQFARYARQLAEQGASVDCMVEPPLVPLLAGQAGVNRAFSEAPGESYDYWSPLLSVPHRLGERWTFRAEPYLTAEPARTEQWRQRLAGTQGKGMRIGLIWAGRPTNANDRYRSMALAEFAPLLNAFEGVTWINLQMGEAAEQARQPGFAERLPPLADSIRDFADTAAILAQLDLVISVDTATAHLAGAMGLPVWTMLHYTADWRWQSPDGTTEWYPNTRLFRQRRLGDWQEVVAEVGRALAERLASQPIDDNRPR